jgi:hypothetical protein
VFSYTLISCANADKKRLKVKWLASFPVASCQAAELVFVKTLHARQGVICRADLSPAVPLYPLFLIFFPLL